MFQIPKCPKCDEPALKVILLVIRARVHCVLNDDGSVGRVVSTTRQHETSREYECGGGHVWATGSEGAE